MEHLKWLSIHAPSDAPVIINGEYVQSLSVELQNPVGRRGGRSGIDEQFADGSRKKVVSIAANGREHNQLPVIHYDWNAR